MMNQGKPDDSPELGIQIQVFKSHRLPKNISAQVTFCLPTMRSKTVKKLV